MMKKLALALLLALPAGAFAPAAGGARALHAPVTPVDGVYRRAAGTRRRGAGRKKATIGRRDRARISRGKTAASVAPRAMLPAVTEIDAAGLKQLLQRGDPQQGAARPLLVNFWATWCVPCRKEFPDLVKIGADYRERGLEFALVSADDVSDIKTAVPQFLHDMRATAMPAYLLNATDTEAAIAQVDPAWGGELPATFLFDRQGKLAYKHFGIIKDAELREAINKVTGDK